MSEKSESDDFEEEEDDPVVEEEDDDLEEVIKDFDLVKHRAPRAGDPAWRRLERLIEEKHTAELTSDFEDYQIEEGKRMAARPRRRKK